MFQSRSISWAFSLLFTLTCLCVTTLCSPVLSEDEASALSTLLANETFPPNWYTCKDGCTSELSEVAFGSWVDKNECCTTIDTYFDRPTPNAQPLKFKDLKSTCCFHLVIGTNPNITSNAFVIALNFRKGTLRQWYMKKGVPFQVPDLFDRFPLLEYIDISSQAVISDTYYIWQYEPRWSLPPSVGFCEKLKVVQFDYNPDLIGSVPESYMRLRQLVRFSLDESNVRGCPYDIARASNATLILFMMNSKFLTRPDRFPDSSLGALSCCPIPEDFLR